MSVSLQKHVASEALAGAVPAGIARPAESLVLLTHDESLIEALGSVVAAESLIVVSDAAALGSELLSGRVGVAFIDATVADGESGAIASLAHRLHQEIPDIVLVVAGDGAAQTELAALVADGTIHRFAHKPISAQRVKLFIDAAWRRRDDTVSANGDVPALPSGAPDLPLKTTRAAPWLTPALGLAIVLAGGVWYLLHQMSEPPSPRAAPIAPLPAPPPTSRSPPPAMTQAVAAADKAADLDRLATAAEQALLTGNLDEARRLTDAARAVDPNHVRVKFLNAQISREQARISAQRRAAATAAAAAAAVVAAPAPASASASAPVAQAATPIIAASATTAFTAPSSTPPASEARDPNSVAAVILHRVYSVDPEFPEIAREQDLAGYVDLEFTVRADGSVTEVTVLKAQPAGVFEKAAVAAVRQWRYQPIERDGQAVDGSARLRLNFGYK